MNISGRLLKLDEPVIMGVINVTPDSFYAQSRKQTEAEIVKTAGEMLENWATIIDVGGYSSRPGAHPVSEEEEMSRLVPAIKAINREFPGIYISADTFRQKVAQAAIDAGARIINDISGNINPAFLAANQVAYICMHMRGTPQNMHEMVKYHDLISEVYAFLFNRLQVLQQHGVNDVIIDPGFGFAKTLEQNYELLDNLQAFSLLGKPVLVGISRKSFIYKKLGITPEEALVPTLELSRKCINKGAKIIRTHDVLKTVVGLGLAKR
jgi:dihydropteroate synthase